MPRPSLRMSLWVACLACLCAGALAACGGSHAKLSTGSNVPELSAPTGTVAGLSTVSHGLARGTAALNQGATELQRQTLGYLALGSSASHLRRQRVVAEISSELRAVEAAYDRVAPLVDATPALATDRLSDDVVGSENRSDASAAPLDAVAGLLTPATVTTTSTALPNGPALIAAVDRLQTEAARLAIVAKATRLTASEVRRALADGLKDVAQIADTWQQGAVVQPIDLTAPRAIVSGLIADDGALGGASPRAVMLESFAPGLDAVATLLSPAEQVPGDAELVATELAWRATDLEAKAARADGEPGQAAAAADRLETELFQARFSLFRGDRSTALLAVRSAQRTFAQALSTGLSPTTTTTVSRALVQADDAVRTGSANRLAGADGQAISGLMAGAYATTVNAIRSAQPALAQTWAAVRDDGPSAAGSVGDDALRAVTALETGTLSRTLTLLAVRRDELDAFQRRDVALVAQTALAADLRHAGTQAEDGALAAGYWRVLAPTVTQSLGAHSTRAGNRAFASLSAVPHAAATSAAASALTTVSTTAAGVLGAFSAAPPTSAEEQQEIPELVAAMRFTTARLCERNAAPAAGTTLPGTVAGPPLIVRLINDLRPSLAPGQMARLETSERALASLPGAAGRSGEDLPAPSTAQPAASVTAACRTATSGIAAVFPAVWHRNTDDTDFVTINRWLDQTGAAAAAGNWSAAESAAHNAYAIFDGTPELRLRAVDPGLALDVEALFWNGSGALFDALAQHAGARQLATVRSRLDATLQRGQIELETSHSGTAVVVNSAIVVFREGLEALLIVAALGAGFVSAKARWRRPVVVGAAAALPVTLITWGLASALLGAFTKYGLSLQAVLDLLALGMLAVMLTWFFQKFCWTRFTAREQARHQRWLGHRALKGLIGPTVGLYALGFFLVYQEGFETVLFLQALRVEAGATAVLEGVLLGALFTVAIGVLMLLLRRRLAYRAVVVVTAILIGILTVAMAGQTARALQATGWLTITPVNVALPNWTGLWMGLYPSVQTLAAQLLTAVAIGLVAVGSSRRRTRRLARQMTRARAEREARIAQRRAAVRPDLTSAVAGSGGAPAALSVIIPAFDETLVIGRCLASIEAQALTGPVQVVVVANGCSDDTAAHARSFEAALARRGCDLHVVETRRASKAVALNLGDTAARFGDRVYLDADVELSPGALSSLATALGAGIDFCSPRIDVVAHSAFGRAYGHIWTQLPYVAGDVIGAGVYAVSARGRTRWAGFPALGCDDKFARLHFARGERVVLEDCSFRMYLPEGLRELVRVRSRWIRLNRQLQRDFPKLAETEPARLGGFPRFPLMRPDLWRDLPAFIAIYGCAEIRARLTDRRDRPAAWERAARMREVRANLAPTPAPGPAPGPRRDGVPRPGELRVPVEFGSPAELPEPAEPAELAGLE